ncbi:unnamed protein product [Symbiodinium microadriaticum]|nr:unnamed protein product [Symbiodinium microadriaticum]
MARFYYDFYVYRYFPSWLPSLAAILSFVSFFPCIEYLGWLWGLAAYAVLHTCLFDKMMEATIESRLSKVNQGSGAAMLLGLVVNHAIFVQQYASTNLTAIFYLQALLTLGLMYKSSTTPATRSRALLTTDRKEVLSRVVASSPSEGPHDSEEVLTAISKQPPIRLCATCLIDKDADTSKHCPTCDVCMNSQLDHHCTFLNNCVGEGNRRVFTGLLLAAVMGCLLAAYMNISVGVSVYCPDKHEKTIEWLFTVQKCLFLEHRSFDMMLLLSMGLVLWTGLQLYGQIIMVAYETTIFEVARDRNVKECMPCSRVCGNLKTFACQGKYKISRREGALEEERALLARGEDSNQSRSHSHHHHSHDHGGHCEHEDEAPLLGGDKRGRFRPGSFDLEMNAPNPIREVQAESMARDRSL